MFSERHGFTAAENGAVILHGAPAELRQAVAVLAMRFGLSFSEVRTIVCDELVVLPQSYRDKTVESSYFHDEIVRHLHDCRWFKIYDIAEALYARLEKKVYVGPSAHHRSFEKKLNVVFREQGVGWRMIDGKIQYRGSDTFERVAESSMRVLGQAGLPNAQKELREAIADISRRPDPDVTGAVHHAMSALEATARQVTGQRKPNLGRLIGFLKLRPPLDKAVDKLWGFASNEARHGSEESSLNMTEAALIVAVAGAVCEYIIATTGDAGGHG